MSATASDSHGVPHEARLDPGKVPLFFRPLVLFWHLLERFYDWALTKVPGARDNPNIKDYSPYCSVFTCLLIGTVVTVGVAVADREWGIFLGKTITWLDLTVGLFIATVKASLVLAFFMHLNHEAKLIYRVMALTAGFVFFMFFLCILALLDKPGDYHHTTHGLNHEGFDNSSRDPFVWKVPHHEAGHGDAHGAKAEHGAESNHGSVGPDAAGLHEEPKHETSASPAPAPDPAHH